MHLPTSSLSPLVNGGLLGCLPCTFAQVEQALAAPEKGAGQKAEDAGHTLETDSCEQA